jgi:fructokinase
MLLGWHRAHIIKISEEEAQYLTGESDLIRAGRSLWHDRLKLITVTLGRHGCIYLTSRFQGTMDGIAADTVDITGAGDGLLAGLLRGLLDDPGALDDEPRLREVCRLANIVGALTTTERERYRRCPISPGSRAFSLEPKREDEAAGAMR